MDKKKIVLLGIGVVGLASLGYYLYNRNQTNDYTSLVPEVSSSSDEKEVPPTHLPAPSRTGSNKSVFPIKKGSRGEVVKMIQKALIMRYGKSILPKYGADGHFGTETQTALESKGLPTVITQEAFNHLNAQFHNMGLKLNGFESHLGNIHRAMLLQMHTKGNVWNAAGEKMMVRRDTILGYFIDGQNGITKFRTPQNETLYVHTKNISYV